MMFRSMASVLGVTLLAVGAEPATAHAQTRDAAAADALFQQGRDAMKKGDLSRACSKFAESERLDPAAGTLLNLADCEEKAGRLASALAHLRGALDLMPATDERVVLARTRIASLDRRVPRLTIALGPNAPRDTRVRRGDVELGPASLATSLPVDPGTIVVVASAPGHVSRRFEVSVAAGQVRIIAVEPGPLEIESTGAPSSSPSAPSEGPEQTRPSEAAADAGRGRQIAGWALVGAGALGIGVGIAALGRRQSELDAAAERCADDPTTGRAACAANDTATAAENATAFHDDLAAATRWKTVATVGFVGGAAAAIGGVVLLLAHSSQGSTGVRVTPSFAGVAPSGVTISGAW